MVRFVHLSDLHLGKIWHGIDRTSDILKSFDQVIDFVYQEKIPLMLIAGDIFDKKYYPSGDALESFFSRIKNILQKGIHIVMVTGNHDWNKLHEAFSSLATLSTNLRIFPRVDLNYPIYFIRDLNCQIIPFPYPDRGKLEGEMFLKNSSTSDSYYQISAKFKSYLQALKDKVNNQVPSVLLAHIGIEGAMYGSERVQSLEEEPILGERDLPIWTSYNALGHLHLAQEVRCPTPSFYSGSLEKLDFGEANQDKGFYSVVIDGLETKCEFIKVTTHGMLDLEVNYSELESLRNKFPEILNTYLKLRVNNDLGVLLSEVREKVKKLYPNTVSIDFLSNQHESQTFTSLPTYSDPITAFEDYISQFNLNPEYVSQLKTALHKIILELEEE